MQLETHPLDRVRARRIWDSPIAPYNLPAMQAMIGDLALRRGDPQAATRAYYPAINSNFAPRWPWPPEVRRPGTMTWAKPLARATSALAPVLPVPLIVTPSARAPPQSGTGPSHRTTPPRCRR